MSRKNQTSELKIRVMDVALSHFSDVGVERTNIDKILKGAECSVGSLYHHFGNKEGVAEALFIDGVDQFNTALLQALLPQKTAKAGIKAIVTFCCEWVTNKSRLAAFLLSREIKLSESAKQELRELDSEFSHALHDWFVPHVSSGALLKLPTDMYMALISGPTLEYSRRWLAQRSQKPPGDVASILSEAAWQAVKNNAKVAGRHDAVP
ncbi:MAG: AcrR family transcriptional regulator [Flavobacterium sp.]|jgi:AcrR family transcriptional regulator